MDVHPTWGREHTLGQIADQAGQSGVSIITKALKPLLDMGAVRLVSQPEVVAAMMPVGQKR